MVVLFAYFFFFLSQWIFILGKSFVHSLSVVVAILILSSFNGIDGTYFTIEYATYSIYFAPIPNGWREKKKNEAKTKQKFVQTLNEMFIVYTMLATLA